MKLILIILASYGITSFLVESIAFRWGRNILSKIQLFDLLLKCMFCTGFWVGYWISFYWNLFTEYFGYNSLVINNLQIFNPTNYILSGFMLATTTWFLCKIEER